MKQKNSLHLDFEGIPKTAVRYDGLAKHFSGFLNTSGEMRAVNILL